MQLQLTPEQEQKFQDLKAKAEHKAQELAHDVKEFAHKAGEKMSEIHPQDIVRDTGEMIKKQTTLYNRSRQAMITKELIEIISGAEAL